jgi:alkaline phosphatase D
MAYHPQHKDSSYLPGSSYATAWPWRKYAVVSRRTFLTTAAGAALYLPFASTFRSSDHIPFQHGVASGDPLADRVILWTRVTPTGNELAVPVVWTVSTDPTMRKIVKWGLFLAGPERDYTVKVEPRGLHAGTTYYYQFAALGRGSPVGRTRTLPVGNVDRLRLAVVSCANWPDGFFNVYGNVARRTDLDAILHLGDYLYEYANGEYGDGTTIGRLPEPDKEIVSLEEYRTRHAQYKSDPQLQEAHRQHPFITVWDDHEFANDAWFGGAEAHDSEQGDGSWVSRRTAAAQAYFEWLPIREPAGVRSPIYRHFAFGNLLDLLMLDTRITGRDEQAFDPIDDPSVRAPGRQILGAGQERWLFDQLDASAKRDTVWRLLGQQVMMGQLKVPPGEPIPFIIDERRSVPGNLDQWDGYAASRMAVLDHIEQRSIDNVVVLTGDIHSSWGLDISKDPYVPAVYDPETGEGSLAVEFVAPGVTSPALEDADLAAISEAALYATQPHLKYVELNHRGYLLLDITAEQTQAEWYFTPTVTRRTSREISGGTLLTKAGSNHLETSDRITSPRTSAPSPAP